LWPTPTKVKNMNAKYSSVTLNGDGQKTSNKIRLALVVLADPKEIESIIEKVEKHPGARIIYQRTDVRPLWITLQAPPRESRSRLP